MTDYPPPPYKLEINSNNPVDVYLVTGNVLGNDTKKYFKVQEPYIISTEKPIIKIALRYPDTQILNPSNESESGIKVFDSNNNRLGYGLYAYGEYISRLQLGNQTFINDETCVNNTSISSMNHMFENSTLNMLYMKGNKKLHSMDYAFANASIDGYNINIDDSNNVVSMRYAFKNTGVLVDINMRSCIDATGMFEHDNIVEHSYSAQFVSSEIAPVYVKNMFKNYRYIEYITLNITNINDPSINSIFGDVIDIESGGYITFTEGVWATPVNMGNISNTYDTFELLKSLPTIPIKRTIDIDSMFYDDTKTNIAASKGWELIPY